MATLTDFDDDSCLPDQRPSAARLYELLIANEAALRQAIYGTRQGVVNGHNHASKGGEVLARPLQTVILGPYARPGSGASALRGIPLYPPGTGISSYVTQPKLVAHCGIYLPGGVNGIAVRLAAALVAGGTRSLTLRVTIRPFSKSGLAADYGGNTGIVTLNASGANTLQSGRVQLAPLASMGDPNSGRWFELLFYLVSDPPAGSTYRFLGWRVVPVAISSTPPPPVGLGVPFTPLQSTEIYQGAPLTERLLSKAVRIFDSLTLGALGRVPGKAATTAQLFLDNAASKFRAFTRDLFRGFHQHTGKLYFDGAIIPWQLASFSLAENLGDDAGSTSNNAPVLGAKTDPAAAGNSSTTANMRKFRVRVPVPRGTERLVLLFAVAPKHSDSQGRLYLQLRSWTTFGSNYQASPAADIITGIDSGQLSESTVKAGAFWQVEVQPQDGDIWVENSAVAAFGLLGYWSDAMLLADSKAPVNRVSAFSNYRVAKPVYLRVNPLGRTADVIFEFVIYLQNQAGTVKSTECLQWLAVGAVEGS